MERRKWKNKTFLAALKHSLDGTRYTFQNERSFKIQLVFAIAAIVMGVFLKLSTIEFAILFMIIGLELFAELINTGIEVMLDLYSQEYNETIKIAKDIASGAVFITSVIAVLIGCVLFLPKILEKLM